MNLVELQEKGIELYLEKPDTIRYRGPEAVLTPALVEELRQHKAELLAELAKADCLYAPPIRGSIVNLLAWASELAEEGMVLTSPVSYVEAPQRTITTGRVSYYASHYLKTIISARHYQQHPKLCWSLWTPDWWGRREIEAMSALAALREAIKNGNGHKAGV